MYNRYIDSDWNLSSRLQRTVYVHMYVYIYVNTQDCVYLNIRTYISAHVCLYIRVYDRHIDPDSNLSSRAQRTVYVHLYVCIYAHIHTCVSAYV